MVASSTDQPATALYTIGYQGLDPARFLRYMKTYHVTILVDVRDVAWSRKSGFSKSALAAAMDAAGIDYVHVPELGSPPGLRRCYHSSGDFNSFAKGYRKHMLNQGQALAHILALLEEGQTVCLMCFEQSHEDCHRSLVAHQLAHLREGLRVKPLPAPGL